MICNVSLLSKEFGKKHLGNVTSVKTEVMPNYIALVIVSGGEEISMKLVSNKYTELRLLKTLADSLQGYTIAKKSFYDVTLKIEDDSKSKMTSILVNTRRYKTKDFTSKTTPVGSRKFEVIVDNVIYFE